MGRERWEYLPDEKKGRRMIKRNTEKDFKRFFEDDCCFAELRIRNVKYDEIIPF